MRITTLFRQLLGVRGMGIGRVGFEENGLVLEVRPRWRKPRCGACGRQRPIYDKTGVRVWRHLALGKQVFWLRYAPRRVDCPPCGVRVEKVPWAAHGSRFTHDLEEMAAYLAQRMDKTAVTRLLGIDWRTVGTIIQRIVTARLDPERLEELYIIGIDELSFRRRHNYVTVVVDHLKKRVVWTSEGKSAETLNKFFDELGADRAKNISHATLDLSHAYNSVVDERIPWATKVFDRFHLQRMASNAVDEVRRAQMHEVGDIKARGLKHSRWALLKNPWNMNLKQKQRLALVQSTNKRLYRAYLLKESFAHGLDFRQKARAQKHFNDWIAWAVRSKLKPFRKLAKTIKRFMDGILAYVETGLSNGLTEGLNNKTRLITRRAFGFHSAQALTAMIHLCCGGIMLSPPIPQPTPSP